MSILREIQSHVIIYFVFSIGYALIQIPDLFMLLYGTLKNKLENKNQTTTKDTNTTIDISNEKGADARGSLPEDKENDRELLTRHITVESKNVNYDSTAKEEIAKDLKCLQMEIDNRASQIYLGNEKFDRMKNAMSELEKKIKATY